MKKLLTIIAYALFGITIVNGVYLALPTELQEQIPYINRFSSVVLGATSGAFGTALVYLLNWVKATDNNSVDRTLALVENYKQVESKIVSSIDSIKELKEVVKGFQNEVGNLKSEIATLRQENNYLTKLNEVSLNIKRDDMLISEKAKEIINKALGDNNEKGE